ncbi:MAG: SMP-30/gluconolactonase/LRE family protein [Sphingomonas sp.]|nr:SMP-30/gluconolactonase/LRE family protein [Sphingomonas sp.]MDX3885358.1 SMP-30/gluconolactonase/LRE family protein [Sphingomonas sp.]
MAATAPRSVCPVGATLGEGPLWLARDAALWFVDIKEKRVHRFDPDQGMLKSWPAPSQPGWILPIADGGLMVGLQSGLHRFDPATGTFDPHLAPEPHLPGNRLNDATVAPDGQLWFGSMDDAENAATGRIYRLARGQAQAAAAIDPVVITNGPAFAPDGRTLYHVDTLGGRIHAFAVDDDGAPGASRLFATIDPADGHPDGPTVDSEGCLWIGLFGGGAVRRYSPAGELMETVRFPVANVTKIAFGGDDLRTAYATTARKGLDECQLAAQPLAGDLFAFRVDAPGLPVQPIRINHPG